uniref:Uncharacterized protein n=1 Tax=Onchocerca volvulus TaxID=6282 RepID=A0A8R1Y1B8_ONCVO
MRSENTVERSDKKMDRVTDHTVKCRREQDET